MLLIYVTPLAVIAGLALGGRLEHLASQPLRFGWLALIVFGAQWLLVHLPGSTPDAWLGLAYTGSAALLPIVLLANFRLPGFKLLLAGALSNLIVMAANGGFMPITPEVLAAMGRDLSLFELGERLPVRK